MKISVDEIEWWDRIAAAVDLLLRRPDARRGAAVARGRSVLVVGNRAVPPGAVPVKAPADAVTAYIFQDVRDAEILRRLTQMPDETPLDMLAQPVSVYCAEMNSLVSVNDEHASLEDHIQTLQAIE